MDVCRGQRGRGSRGGRGAWRGRGRGGRRGGRRGGGDGTPRNQPELRLKFRDLQGLENKTSDEIIIYLTSSRCFPAMEYLLRQQTAMENAWIVPIVSIVAKACDCSYNVDLLKLLNLLPGSSFLNSLRRYLNKLSANAENAVFLRNVVKIMNELLQRFPNCFADLPLSDLYCGTRRLSGTGKLADDALVTEVDELMKLRIKKAEELKKKDEEEQQRRRNPRRDGEKWRIGRIPVSYLTQSPITIYIKLQLKPKDLSTRLWGINPTNSLVMSRSLVQRPSLLPVFM